MTLLQGGQAPNFGFLLSELSQLPIADISLICHFCIFLFTNVYSQANVYSLTAKYTLFYAFPFPKSIVLLSPSTSCSLSRVRISARGHFSVV